MKVIRKQAFETTEVKIGDQIMIELDGAILNRPEGKGCTIAATAQQITEDGVVFMFDECVTERQMNSEDTNEGGYESSELKTWLETEFINVFPADIRNKIEYITVPSYGQIMGHNDFYKKTLEQDNDDRFQLMEHPKNRLAEQKKRFPWGDDWSLCSYWLRNATRKHISNSEFMHFHRDCCPEPISATGLCGVRPVFLLKNK